MERTLLLAMLLACSVRPCPAEDLTLAALPVSAEEFVALRDAVATTPEGGAMVTLAAFMVLVQDKDLGLVFLTLALDQGNLSAGTVYKGYKPGSGAMFHAERLLDPLRAGIPFSYVLGTVPDDGYRAAPPYRFRITRNQYSVIDDRTVKVFVECSGAASARPMTLRRNDKGIWKALEFSSFSLDVAKPAPKDDL